jgi:Tfp pilus assembly PilM family ATPase
MHLVQFETDGAGNLSTSATVSIPYLCSRDELLNSPKLLRKIVRQALASDKFQGRKVVTTLPSSNVQILPVSYHISSGKSDDDALLSLLGERLDGDLTDYVIDYTRVRTNQLGEERQAIVAVAKRDDVIHYLEALRRSGLEIIHLEIGPSAIRRLISTCNKQNNFENILTINFGRTSSYITVIAGARLLFDQAIRFGEDELLTRIADCLDIQKDSVRQLISEFSFDPGNVSGNNSMDTDIPSTLQEIVKPCFMRLAEEINRTLIYTASQTRGESISRIYLLGGIARWHGCDALLRSLVQLDVEAIPNPLRSFTRKNDVSDTIRPEVALATGLAMHGLIEHE